MTTSQKWTPTINDNMSPAETSVNMRLIWNTLNQHDQAIESVYSTASSSSSSSSSSSTTTVVSGVSSFNSLTGAVSYFPYLGVVNDQTGVVSYTAKDGDDGALVILNATSAIAVSLTSSLTAPWFSTFTNRGGYSVTFTPTSGTINGASSFVLLPGATTTIYYNSTNFYATVQLPISTLTNFGAVKPDGTTISISGGVLSATGSVATVNATTVNATTGNITDINSSGTDALGTVTASTLSSGSITDTGLSTAGYVTNTAAGLLGTVSQIPASGITTALASPPAIGGSSPGAGTFTTLAGNTNVYSPVGNIATVNATTVSASSKVQAGAFAGTGAATIAAGSTTVTGTSPSLAVYGSGVSGEIDFTVGTGPSASGVIATITFPTAYPSTPKAIIVGNGTALPSGSGFSWSTTTTTLVISCNAVLTASSYFKLEYILMA